MTDRRAAVAAVRTLGQAAGICLRAAPGAAGLQVAATLAASLGPVATAWLTKDILDQLTTGSAAALLPGAGALAATTGGLAILQHLNSYTRQELGRRVAAYTQERLFVAVSRLRGMQELEDPGVYDRLRLAQQASGMAPQMLASGLLSIGQSALTAGAFLVSLAALSPLLVALVAASAAPALIAQLSLARDRAGTMLAASPRLRRQLFYAGLLLDLRAAKEIRIFGLSRFFRSRMLSELRGAQRLEQGVDRRTLRLDTALSLVTALVSGVALVFGVAQIARAGSVGDLSVLIAALAGVQAGVAGIVVQVAGLSETLILFGHYEYVTTQLGDDAAQAPGRHPNTAPVRATPVTALRHGIELRDVWFRYDPGHDWVLRGVNLFIPAGRSVALVGANGAGKSTLVKLLCLLYEPQHGSITWDGVDMRKLDLEQLRRRIAVVFQDYMNYDMTAWDNIGIGNLEVIGDEARVPTAAAFAGLHETLSRLPMPEAMPPGATHASAGTPPVRAQRSRKFRRRRPATAAELETSAGVLLSGGQWQRVALARAVLRHDADLLILDEPSAGLDVQAEAAVHRRLQRLRQGRTSLLISHRMNTIRTADVIVVLDGGHVVEQGTHAELMAVDSRYAALFRTQASGYQLSPDQQNGTPMADHHPTPSP